MNYGLSKRAFIKNSLLGIGSIGCGLCNLKLFSHPDDQDQISSLHYDIGDEIDKWTIEARHFVNTPKGIKCLICPNECKILPGEEGDCHTRVNIDGILYYIGYGNPCAVHVDPIEKKPLYHFYPSSKAFSIAIAGCNLACLNCQNWEISQTSPRKTRNFDLMPEEVVDQCIKSDCLSIAYTYSDPVAFYEYAYDTSKIAHSRGIKNVLVSAGYINPEPLKEFCKYIDAANIDLKSFSNEIYEMLNAGKLEPVLESLKILKSEGVWLEITNLLVPSWTDDMDMIKKMCDWLVENGFADTPLHFSRFHPLYKLTELPATPISSLNEARKIALSCGIDFVYIGNVPGTDAENTYCPQCKKLIMERKGFYILQNNLQQNRCSFCKSLIAGYWY